MEIISRLAKVKLKVIDVGSGETRICQFEETKAWDWSNPNLVRLIGGLQITSWDKLVETLHYKVENGCQEVEVHEFPLFMLVGGG